uniref:Uncharacterized protein n=1 Tax=viral metagenome TaxID=1070528 RepID=A0A6M3IKN0_9ZZZZ
MAREFISPRQDPLFDEPFEPNELPQASPFLAPEFVGRPDSPGAMDPPYERPVSPFEPPVLTATAVRGTYDAWLGVVAKVFYDAADGLLANVRTVSTTRSDVVWDATYNQPSGKAVPSAASQPQRTIEACLPWPPRHDQQKYHVAVGDIVTVFGGRDGRCWFLTDELPWWGVVVKAAADDATEDNVGGAGLKTLTIRRQILSGDPDGGAFSGAAFYPCAGTSYDLKDAAGATLVYSDVLVVCQTGQQHGYRVGELVEVTRRGRYLFALPARESFHAVLVSTGPTAEADFTDERYWVREVAATITYAGASDDSYTYDLAMQSQTDPTGSGGRWARWVCAIHDSGRGVHRLPVIASGADPDTGIVVTVHLHRDTASDEAWYSFETNPNATFPVLLTKTSGAAGGAGAICAYLYTVLALDDATELGTGAAPVKDRIYGVTYWYPGETRTGEGGGVASRYGLATYDAGGNLLLLDAYGEIPKMTACP